MSQPTVLRPAARPHRRSTAIPRGGRLEPAADQHGRQVSGSTIRRNGRLQFVGAFRDSLEAVPEEQPEPSRLDELRRRLAKVRTSYRLSGMFSQVELNIMDLAFDGSSLTQIAERLGMTRQAVWYHVQRAMSRAPLFRRFWRYKNRMRGNVRC